MVSPPRTGNYRQADGNAVGTLRLGDEPTSARLTTDTHAAGRHTAVIDIGSGSARAVVMLVNPGGGIEIVAQQRVNLNLMSHVNPDGFLDDAAVADTVDALEDFALVARGFGVSTIHAVATAALRESRNAAAVISAATDQMGLPLRIIDGADEAAFCFVGAIHGLPVSDGLLADIGGGSTEVVGFADRAMGSGVSLPLGSLRIADRFRLTDLPTPGDVTAAYDHVRHTLAAAGIPKLPDGGALVGSGGSVRLLSRMARGRELYPIIKMHGYEIETRALETLTRDLLSLSREERAGLPGTNPERAHSIAGGAIIAHALAHHTGARGITVSGQGLREGLAREVDLPTGDGPVSLPPLASVRVASLRDLVKRFVPRFYWRGERRSAIAGMIGDTAWGGGCPESCLALRCAALLLDIGNAIDYYNRLNRAANIVVRTDLPGFTHRESAHIAAIMLASENDRLPAHFRQSRLFTAADLDCVEQAASALILADELDNRLAPDYPADVVRVARQRGALTVTTPGWSRAAGAGLPERWHNAFGEHIRIERCGS